LDFHHIIEFHHASFSVYMVFEWILDWIKKIYNPMWNLAWKSILREQRQRLEWLGLLS